MKIEEKFRAGIPDVRRVVVKIGSRVLVQKNGRPDVQRMRCLVDELARVNHTGKDVIIVTSGAIGAGMQALKMKQRPTQLPDLQMAAAVGQTRLMSQYSELFGARGLTIGQILMTHDDFSQKIRMMNAKRTIENLIRHEVVPIINENDAVTDEEIRAEKMLGDNDFLAMLVAKLVRADLMLILTTVDGVRAPAPSGRTQRISYIQDVNRKVMALVNPKNEALSTGGMASKLKAARLAARSGCMAVIANGRESGIIQRVMDGRDAGTIILAS